MSTAHQPGTPPELKTVLLRHTARDGSFHFDWMFQTDPAPHAKLFTFRVDLPIQHPEIDQFDAEVIGLHRAAYLHYEGPLTDDRGTVQRVASGTIIINELSDAAIRVHVAWGAGARHWLGNPIAGSVWRFVVDPSPISR